MGSGSRGAPAGAELAVGSPPAGAPCTSRQPMSRTGFTTKHTSARALPPAARARATATSGGSQPVIDLSRIRVEGGDRRRHRNLRGIPRPRDEPGLLQRVEIPLENGPHGYHEGYVRGCFYGPDPDRRRLLEDAPPHRSRSIFHRTRLGRDRMATAKEIETQAPATPLAENSVKDETASLGVRRYFTIPGRDPFDEVDWETRDAHIPGKSGPAFEQKGVEFPRFWSQTATNIVSQKYFRGRMTSPERERSVKQMIGRVVDTIAGWGRADGYFATEEEAETFEAELKAILVNQLASFNSPVWFNVGFEEKPQCSACFILSIEDSMEAILDWIRREGVIFRGGSGSGVNLSMLRSSKEQLSKGGYASGPVSFMRGADASAGTIKSGGKTRRAAKMVVLDVDHPDIEEFIWCKAKEEKKARVLEQAGYDMSLDSPDWASIQYQNANNSVRVTDAFMEACEADGDWNLTARVDGAVVGTVKARKLLKDMAEAAWQCADPGVQYDTTINAWHTCPNTGRINASNPCFPGDARVHTTLGLIRFEELYARAQAGEKFQVYTHRATANIPGEGVLATRPLAVMRDGVKPIIRLRFANGQELRCTPNHRIWTLNRGYVSAEELTNDDQVLVNDTATPAEQASWALPIKVEALARSHSRG